ncbi:MAG: ABC-F family ATP-binding cassette domain-containing protein [Candidatus Cloacimonetes bacterium]|nr:ABC-F family ATP-binding cassette domain-containing protein [Candidatus Cloacimonadota bacterium]
MSEINVNNISKIFSYEYVLNGVSFDISKGERVGLIGRNGTGKTTLFKIITGRERKSGDIGNVVIRKGAVISCLDQIPIYADEVTSWQILYKPFLKFDKIKKEMEILEKQMETASEQDLDTLVEKYKVVQNHFENTGGYEIETRIKWVCVGLKIPESLFNQSFNLLSGGEKTRITLASMLLKNPDVLLLDEPTNHLDMQSVEWLEGYLQKYEGAALIITHDRYFIDRVINKIFVLENGKVTKFNSNYSNYATEMKNRETTALNEQDKMQKEIRKIKMDLKKSIARNAKNHSAFMSAKIRDLTAELEDKKKSHKPQSSKNMGLWLTTIKKSSKIVLRMESICKSFGDNQVLNNLDFYVQKQEKVAIIGANGSGKSTLIRLMMEQVFSGTGLIADRGEVYVGVGIKIGYLDQELEFSDQNLTILETIKQELGIKDGEARSILARFLFFTNDIDKTINIISGGEKTRLRLAILVNRDLNTLILDEPTNHLDIQSRELLENVLEKFEGSVIFISHDRYFINKLAKKIAELENGKIKIFEGNYDFYRTQIEEKRLLLKPKSVEKDDDYTFTKKERNRIQKRKRNLKTVENQIAKLEDDLKVKGEEMYHFPTDYQKLQEIISEKDEIQMEIDKLLEEWEKLSI